MSNRLTPGSTLRPGLSRLPGSRKLLRALLRITIVVCTASTAVSAQPLQKREDAEGNVHFGTLSDPMLCCMCQPALDYETRHSQTTFFLEHGLERAVSNDRVYLSGDGKAWYCEGIREMGHFSRKCGLTPQVM